MTYFPTGPRIALAKWISRKDVPDTHALMLGEIGFKEDTVPKYECVPYGSLDHCRSAIEGYRKHSNALKIVATWPKVDMADIRITHKFYID